MRLSTRQEAAQIIRRIVDKLPMPAGMASYLSGYAAGLEARIPRRPVARDDGPSARPR